MKFTKQKIMDSAVRKLKVQVAKSDDLNGQQKMSIVVFIFVFLSWIFAPGSGSPEISDTDPFISPFCANENGIKKMICTT